MDYKIGKVERTNFLDERGRATDGYRVWYTLANGISDYVEVEKANYKPDVVREMIEEEVALHEALTS
jgi:hypothetical protein